MGCSSWCPPACSQCLVPSRPGRLVGLASAVLSRAFPALRLELREELPGAPSGCSPQRELIALPYELPSTLRSPPQRIWWVGKLPKQGSQAGPPGHLWGHPFAFCLKSLLWSQWRWVGGTGRDSYSFLSLYRYQKCTPVPHGVIWFIQVGKSLPLFSSQEKKVF